MNDVSPSTTCLPRRVSFVHPQRLALVIKEMIIIAVCAMVPALILYCVDGAGNIRPTASKPIPAGALWIDARSAADYSREHVPAALNLNIQNWDSNLAQLFATWQPPQPIVVYCSAGCSSAAEVAEKLATLGLEPVEVYEGGFEAWKQANVSSGK